MARHEVIIHENTGALRETAPYIGNYISKEQIAMAAFAATVGAKCGLPPIQVIAIIDGAFEAISALERDALVRVRTDIGVVCGVITGSFPTADAPFDAERNALEMALRLDDEIRLDLADVVPVIVTDENVTKLRVDNVMDLAEERPMNLIHGQHVFRVAGFNMVLTDEGAVVFLENALGTRFQVIIDEIVSKQLFKAHTSELLPPGDYKLVVMSRAGDAGGPLQTSFRKVKYLRVVDPGPTVPTVTDIGEGFFHPGHGNVVTGENMRFADGEPGNHVVVKDGTGVDMEAMVSTDTRVPVTETGFSLNIDEGTPLTDGEEYTFEFAMVDSAGQPVTVTHTARWQSE